MYHSGTVHISHSQSKLCHDKPALLVYQLATPGLEELPEIPSVAVLSDYVVCLVSLSVVLEADYSWTVE